mgnify:CR=1 FL=1
MQALIDDIKHLHGEDEEISIDFTSNLTEIDLNSIVPIKPRGLDVESDFSLNNRHKW